MFSPLRTEVLGLPGFAVKAAAGGGGCSVQGRGLRRPDLAQQRFEVSLSQDGRML